MWCNKINCKHIMYYIVVDFYYFAIYSKHPLVMYIMYKTAIRDTSRSPPLYFWIYFFVLRLKGAILLIQIKWRGCWWFCVFLCFSFPCVVVSTLQYFMIFIHRLFNLAWKVVKLNIVDWWLVSLMLKVFICDFFLFGFFSYFLAKDFDKWFNKNHGESLGV